MVCFLKSPNYCLFVTEDIPVTVSQWATNKEARPSPYLLFLTPRPAISSHQHRTFWSGNLFCSPRVLWAAGCIQAQNHSFSDTYIVIPGWSCCQQALKHNKAGIQTSSHPQNLAFHLFGLQGPQQTPDEIIAFCKICFKIFV